MDNIFIILVAAFIITMVLWLLYTVFFSLSENEKRKRKKKVKYVDREVIKKEKIKETKIKEYTVKDMRQEKNIDKVSIVEESVEETEEEPQEYGNYMYDVLVERNTENKVYHTEPNLEQKEDINKIEDELILLDTNNLSNNQPKKYYGQVQDVDYVKIVNSLKKMENKQNDKNETLASEFKSLSKEMKIYIIDNIIGNL